MCKDPFDIPCYIKDRQTRIAKLKTIKEPSSIEKILSFIFTKRVWGWKILGCFEKCLNFTRYSEDDNGRYHDHYEYLLFGKSIYSAHKPTVWYL